MKRLVATLALTLAMTGAAFAQTAPVPAGTPPAPGTPTANLVLDAMLAAARAASINPSGAQSASLNSSAAIQRYNTGDMAGARSAAIQALIEANRLPPTSNPIVRSTIPQTSALQTGPFPIAGGSVAAIDAGAFVGLARGAVGACTAQHSPNTPAAQQHLTAAERGVKAGQYQTARTEAKAAVDLCAAAQQHVNGQP